MEKFNSSHSCWCWRVVITGFLSLITILLFVFHSALIINSFNYDQWNEWRYSNDVQHNLRSFDAKWSSKEKKSMKRKRKIRLSSNAFQSSKRWRDYDQRREKSSTQSKDNCDMLLIGAHDNPCRILSFTCKIRGRSSRLRSNYVHLRSIGINHGGKILFKRYPIWKIRLVRSRRKSKNNKKNSMSSNGKWSWRKFKSLSTMLFIYSDSIASMLWLKEFIRRSKHGTCSQVRELL